MLETIEAPPPIETVTPLRASEAIRLGCLTTTQDFGKLGEHGTACVMGALYIGLGLWDGQTTFTFATAIQGGHGRLLNSLSFPCPICGPNLGVAGPAHLNDEHHWTREQIADWLESEGL